MSTTQGSFGNSNTGGPFGAPPWSYACFGSRWTPVELIALVIGFMIFWPIGLAILGFKYWQRKTNGPDLQTVAAGAYRNARSAMGSFSGSSPRPWTNTWTYGHTSPTGNRAFDEWRNTELGRLEEERRRLEEAHREFAEWLDGVRKAKDREEFERFMNERRGKTGA